MFKTLDKIALAKAVGVLAMSWFALPVLYSMFKKKEVEDGKEKQGRSNDQSEGTSGV